jgi:hypothetical protein
MSSEFVDRIKRNLEKSLDNNSENEANDQLRALSEVKMTYAILKSWHLLYF